MSEHGFDKIVTQAESLSPLERAIDYVDVNLYTWLDRDLRRELKELIPVKHRDYEWKRKMVELQNNTARALHVFLETNSANPRPEVAAIWDTKVKELIFGRDEKDPNAIINCVKNEKEDTRMQLLGPYSVVTLVDALGRARPDMKGKGMFEPVGIMTPPEIDIKGYIDLVFRMGDSNSLGEKVLRVAQLKAYGGTLIRVTRVTSENLYNLPQTTPEYGKRMIQTGKKLASKEVDPTESRVFLIEVPGYYSKAVNEDTWGRIRDDDIIKRFKDESVEQGFLPI